MVGREFGEDAGCGVIAPLLERFAAAELGSEDERQVWEHLAGCAACRARRVTLADPGALFLELRDSPLADRHWDGFMERLGERLDGEAAPDRRRWWSGWGEMVRYPRLAYVAAPLAMVLVVGTTLFVLRPGARDLPGRLTPAEAIRSPYNRPVPPRPPRPDQRIAGGRIPDLALSVSDFDSSGPPALEEVVSPGAPVYRFDVGGETDAPPIYLVVDESIDF
jgi:hypothetical protein